MGRGQPGDLEIMAHLRRSFEAAIREIRAAHPEAYGPQGIERIRAKAIAQYQKDYPVYGKGQHFDDSCTMLRKWLSESL